MSPRIIVICKNCEKNFLQLESHHQKFCSRECYFKWRKGKTYEELYGEERGKELRTFQKKKWSTYNKKKQDKLKKLLSKRGMGHPVLPESRIKIGRGNLLSSEKRPTGYEWAIIDLCEEYSLPFKYVGNGSFWIGYGNPDFIESNGHKLVIETYCKYWHEKNYEKTRKEQFECYNYKTLFLNDNDFENENNKKVCLDKILNFLQENQGIV